MLSFMDLNAVKSKVWEMHSPKLPTDTSSEIWIIIKNPALGAQLRRAG